MGQLLLEGKKRRIARSSKGALTDAAQRQSLLRALVPLHSASVANELLKHNLPQCPQLHKRREVIDDVCLRTLAGEVLFTAAAVQDHRGTVEAGAWADGDESQRALEHFSKAASALWRHMKVLGGSAPDATTSIDTNFTVQFRPTTIKLPLAHTFREGLCPLLGAFVTKATWCLRWGVEVLSAELAARLHLQGGRLGGGGDCFLPSLLEAACTAYLFRSAAFTGNLRRRGGVVDAGIACVALSGGPLPVDPTPARGAACPQCGLRGLDASSLAAFKRHTATCAPSLRRSMQVAGGWLRSSRPGGRLGGQRWGRTEACVSGAARAP